MRRRRLIQSVGAIAAGGLAGCVGGRRDPAGGTPTESPHETPAEPTARFELLSQGCGTQANRADVAAADGTVTVEGTIWGNDACARADLESVVRDGPSLSVSVVTERDVPDGGGCAQCIVEIDYRVEVDVASPVETVVVTHDGETVARASP